MSESYRMEFSFDLDPTEGAAERAFRALADGRAPDAGDLAALPRGLGPFLHDGDRDDGTRDVRLPGAFGPPSMEPTSTVPPGGPPDPRYPRWRVRFALVLHDDGYWNGGYFALPARMAALIAGAGLLCTVTTEGRNGDVQLFYVDGEDVVHVSMAEPALRPRRAAKLYDRPGTGADAFGVGSVQHITPTVAREMMALPRWE